LENSEQKELLDDVLDPSLMDMIADAPDDEQLEAIVTDSSRRASSNTARRTGWQKSLLLYVHDFAYLLSALIVVSLLLLRVVVVSGTSMNRTLLDGDYLFVLSNTVYRQPDQGDIVVISKESFDNGRPIVKRVIAVEGQTVEIKDGMVFVDGEALVEEYALGQTHVYSGKDLSQTVEPGCVFVLGDNRGVSRDSRYPEIGQVRTEEILGKVVFLFMPGTNGTDYFGNPKEERDWTRIGVVG
jgi:signal peptidase I